MANVKISALPPATTVAASDLLPVVQGGVTKQVTPDLLPLSAAAATALAAKAGLASPAFTGSPTIGGTTVAKTSDITAAITALVGSAPAALDTLQEIDAQLTTDEGSAAALAALVAGKAAALTAQATRTVSATLTADTVNPFDATAGPLTATLPTPGKTGQVITVEKVDTTANLVTIAGTLRGTVGSMTISTQYESIVLVAESLTSWRPVAGHRTKTALDTAIAGQVTTQATTDAATYATKAVTAGPLLNAHFQGDDQRLFMALSPDDGAHWRPVPDLGAPAAAVFSCPAGAIRDPSISPRRHADGYWYMAHTVLPNVTSPLQTATGTGFHLDRSKDLVNWTPVQTITVTAGTTKAWAPDFFEDPADGSWHVIVTSNTNGMWETHPVDQSNPAGAWSTAVLLSIGTAGYDGTIVKQGSTYVLAYVNAGICFGQATAVTGPYTKFAGPITGTNGLEGPSLVQLPDGRWRCFIDTANEGTTDLTLYKYMDSSSSDLLTCTWGGLVSTVGDTRMRHGTTVRLTGREAAVLADALPPLQQRRGNTSLRTSTSATTKTFTVPDPFTDVTMFATVDLMTATATASDVIRLGATGDMLAIQATAAGAWQATLDSPTGVNGTGATGQTVTFGTQTTGRHVLAVRLKGLTMTGYVDGVSVGTLTANRGNGAVWGSLFGQYSPAVDSAEVYFRALTDREIADQSTRVLGAASSFDQSNALTVGQETFGRHLVNSNNVSTGSGNLRISFFTARKSETVSQVRTLSGGAAAAATPTLAKVGLYAVDTITGALTLVASTPSTTTLWAASGTSYTTAFAAPVAVTAGRRYAIGVLVVTAVAAPTLAGNALGFGGEFGFAPRLSGLLSGQADLPATIADASLTSGINLPYAAILP